MKTLLISLNSKFIHSSLAVWYLAQSVREKCSGNVQVSVLEGTVNQPEEEIFGRITRAGPDILAFSCYIWNIAAVSALVPSVKKALPSARIILGGPEVSYNPEEVLSKNPDADYIIAGEGEIPFPQLLAALYQKEDIRHIPGLCRREGGAVRRNPPAPPLPEPPSPYSKEYLGTLCGRIAYLETSRGCPFSCAFCLSGQNSCHVRFFDIECAKKNLLLLANSGAQTVKLVDRTFNCDAERAYELFDFLIQNAEDKIPPGVCFHFEVAADLFNEKTLRLLCAAPPGLIQLEAGIQSFNPETLAAVTRKTDTARMEKNIRAVLSAGNIHLHADLIAGLPREGLRSFARSFDRAYALGPHMLQLGFLKMLHGSELRRRASDLGYAYSPKPPYEVTSAPWFPEDELRLLRCAEYALNKLYNSGRFARTLKYILEASGIRPFAFYLGAGKALLAVPLSERRSLDAFTRQAYTHFLTLPGTDQKNLRDALVCDRIACGQKIPDFLKVPDHGLKKALGQIRNVYFNGRKDIRISAALLYTGGKRAVFARGEKDPVTGRLPLCFLD